MPRDPNRLISEGEKMSGEEKGGAPIQVHCVLGSRRVVVKSLSTTVSAGCRSWLWEGRKPRKSVSVATDTKKL